MNGFKFRYKRRIPAKGDRNFQMSTTIGGFDVSNTQCRHNRTVLRCRFCNPRLEAQKSANIVVEHKFIPSRGSVVQPASRVYNGSSRMIQMKMDNDKQCEENNHLKYVNGKAMDCTKFLLQERAASNYETQKLQKELGLANQCVTAAQFIIKQLQQENVQDIVKISVEQAEKEKLAVLLKQVEDINQTENRKHMKKIESITKQNCCLQKELEKADNEILELKSTVATKDEWIGELANKIKLQDCEVEVVRQVNDEFTLKIKDLQDQIHCTEMESEKQKQKLEMMGDLKIKYDRVSVKNEELVNKLRVSRCLEKEWRKKVEDLDAVNHQLRNSIGNYKQTIVELNQENESDKAYFRKEINNFNQHGVERKQLADKIKELEIELKEKIDLIDNTEIASKSTMDGLQKQIEDDQKQHGVERKQLADKIKELEIELKEKIDLIDNTEIASKSTMDGLQKQIEDDQKQHGVERKQLAEKIKELEIELKENIDLIDNTEITSKSTMDGLQKQIEDDQKQHGVERKQLADKIKELEIELKENIDLIDNTEITSKSTMDGLQKQIEDDQKQHGVERKQLAEKIKELEIELKENIDLIDNTEITSKSTMDGLQKQIEDDQKQHGVERKQLADKIKELEIELKENIDLIDNTEITSKSTMDGLQKQIEDDQKQHGVERKQLADKIMELEIELKEKIDLIDNTEIASKSTMDGLQKQIKDDQKQYGVERKQLADKIKELEIQLKESEEEKMQQVKRYESSEQTSESRSLHERKKIVEQPIYESDEDEYESDIVTQRKRGKQRKNTTKHVDGDGFQVDGDGFQWIADSSSDDDSADEWKKDREIYRFVVSSFPNIVASAFLSPLIGFRIFLKNIIEFFLF